MASISIKVTGGCLITDADFETVGEAKDRLNFGSYTAKVNGEDASDDFELTDEDFVVLSKKVKGGQ